MAWIQSSEGKDKKYAIFYEDMVPKSVAGNGAANWSSIIDFIPPGADWTVIMNAGATALSVSTHVELWVAYTKSAVPHTTVGKALRYRKTDAGTGFQPVTTALTTGGSTKLRSVDVSARGEYPYYFLKVPAGGTKAATNYCRMVITVGKPQNQVQ